MKKIHLFLLLAIVTLIGSIATYYTTNLLLTDLLNYESEFYYFANEPHTIYLPASFPGFVIAIYFIVAAMFIVRYQRHQNRLGIMLKHYSIVYMVLSILGIVFTIITGAVVYKSFIKPYPFTGYTIICLIIHLLMLLASILIHIKNRNTPKVEEAIMRGTRLIKFILYSILLYIVVYVSFYRLGSFLLAFESMEWSALYLTFPFYISLLLPVSLLLILVLNIFGYTQKKLTLGVLLTVVVLLLSVITGLSTFIIGMNNTLFVSSVSHALPLERMMSLPMDVVIHFGFMIIFSIYVLATTIKFYLKAKRREK